MNCMARVVRLTFMCPWLLGDGFHEAPYIVRADPHLSTDVPPLSRYGTVIAGAIT